MNKSLFCRREDIEQIRSLGLDIKGIQRQLSYCKRRPYYLWLEAPCTINNGIRKISPRQKKKLIEYYERESEKHRIVKFVPASGAASRMFAAWFTAAEKGDLASFSADRSFLQKLKKMPFFPLLKRDDAIRRHLKGKNISALLRDILYDRGLNLGEMPKALIPFHLYAKKDMRTALEEHIYEAAGYVADAKNVCWLHITVSPEHRREVARKLHQFKPLYENICKVKYKFDLSVQSPATSVLALDEKNKPLRDNQGKLVFRPGGHGALLDNLNNLDADVIFVKNIDNVAPQSTTGKIMPYRKMLGGIAIEMIKKIQEILMELIFGDIDEKRIKKIAAFCRNEVNICFPHEFNFLNLNKKRKMIFNLLNRPLRVCAMVKNTGEPGGGPFWVKEKGGARSLQIVELPHVNKNNPSQMKIWSQATHFNPVDMVCCIKNYQGNKFDLRNYINSKAFLVTTKAEKGRKIKALELPGLWNGCMSDWNTIFVEIPLMTFNPVKTVNDLLRPQHLASRKLS